MRLSIYVFALLSCLAFSRCTAYQFATLSSAEASGSTEEYIVETDTLLIRYSFQGEGAPVLVHIENKLNQPLYIDWSRSALVVGNETFPYWRDAYDINTVSQHYYISTTTTGVAERPDRISFIAPRAFVESTRLALAPGSSLSALRTTEARRVIRRSPYGSYRVSLYAFTEDNSPLAFRSYLTLSTQMDGSASFAVDTHFWVSQVLQTLEPMYRQLYRSLEQKPFTFYSVTVL
ncbi:hypothetical protein SAMN05421823_111242 [Catalinimonas alkaloidigena]|uniref:Uncharacterized protein n=1 Tax=Catalinimonas alkaloidigena TaxID=1075417 RepID=A0A1G9RRU2_9BACT|nr:hypothetical protein [Catalinimonas alkaloidigena]SDM25800.1 hypothetical protein SAMN05421823_111242 [Catalinimonas alkaloidigena]